MRDLQYALQCFGGHYRRKMQIPPTNFTNSQTHCCNWQTLAWNGRLEIALCFSMFFFALSQQKIQSSTYLGITFDAKNNNNNKQINTNHCATSCSRLKYALQNWNQISNALQKESKVLFQNKSVHTHTKPNLVQVKVVGKQSEWS